MSKFHKPIVQRKYNSDVKQYKEDQEKYFPPKRSINFQEAKNILKQKIVEGIMTVTQRRDSQFYEYILSVYFSELPDNSEQILVLQALGGSCARLMNVFARLENKKLIVVKKHKMDCISVPTVNEDLKHLGYTRRSRITFKIKKSPNFLKNLRRANPACYDLVQISKLKHERVYKNSVATEFASQKAVIEELVSDEDYDSEQDLKDELEERGKLLSTAQEFVLDYKGERREEDMFQEIENTDPNFVIDEEEYAKGWYDATGDVYIKPASFTGASLNPESEAQNREEYLTDLKKQFQGMQI